VLKPPALIFWKTSAHRSGFGRRQGWYSAERINVRWPRMDNECESQVTAEVSPVELRACRWDVGWDAVAETRSALSAARPRKICIWEN
jgi:hypothetical protein